MMSKLYNWAVTKLACCGCVIGFAFLPVMTAGGFTTWMVLT